MLESALISTSALALLEGVAHIARGFILVLSAGTHSAVAGDFLLLAALLAATGFVLKLLLGVKLLLTSSEHPVRPAVLAIESSISEFTGGLSVYFIFFGHSAGNNDSR